MKRSTLISLICSMIAVIVVIVGIILIMIAGNALDVGKQKLILSSASSAAIYDGTPLSNSKWYLTEGDLKEGHQLSVNVTGVQTTVGISENHISATVQDENGADVTEDYNIEYRPGMLNVKARDLSLIADSAFKLYDGEPLTCEEYTVESAISLLEGDELDVSIEGSITEIGETLNRITAVSVKNEQGADVTRNYNIKTKDGKLIVLSQTTLLIQTKSDAKLYDGEPLKNATWELVSGELRSGHTLKVDVTGEQTVAGSSDNVFSATVVDENGNDVSEMYEMKYLPGTLTVVTAEFTVITSDAEKPYDGTELTKHTFKIEPATFIEKGYQVIPVFTGTQTEVGISENTVNQDMTIILDPEGNNVTDSFKIAYEFGTLTVTESLPLIPPDTVLFEVHSNRTTALYLKERSYGDYHLATKSWQSAPEYSKMISGARSAYYLPAYAMANSTLPNYEVTIKPLAGIYVLPYYALPTTQTQSSDVQMSGSTDQPYSVNFYDFSGGSLRQDPTIANYEEEYLNFVRDHYLDVDPEIEQLMLEKIEEQKFDPNNANIINQVARYIQNSATYSKDEGYLGLNNPIDRAENPVEAFFELKEGVCRHYALAATMMYRTLGIPARYTEGFMAEVAGGQYTTIKAERAHAWVEVYVKGIGWQYIEVTGSAPEDPEDQIIELTVKPTKVKQRFNGSPLIAPQTVTGLTTLDSLGYTYEVTVSGQLNTPGQTVSKVEELIIRDQSGEIVYQKSKKIGEDKFKITYKTETMHLYLEELVYRSDSLEPKVYNGVAVTGNVSQIHWVSGNYSGYTVKLIPTGSCIDEGTVDNTFDVQVFQGDRDVTDWFLITKKYGKITVTKRSITITSGDASCKFFDLAEGEKLTCNTYTAENLASTDHVEICKIVGALDYFGECDNTIESVEIQNAAGQDVTKNYSISYNFGKLKIT